MRSFTKQIALSVETNTACTVNRSIGGVKGYGKLQESTGL